VTNLVRHLLVKHCKEWQILMILKGALTNDVMQVLEIFEPRPFFHTKWVVSTSS
jgi:hypothetical protein